jgi:anti-anti-sigma regulatory factor
MQLMRGCIVASVQVQLSEEVLHAFQQDLLEKVRATRARAVILDLSGVSILDSSDFESILRTLRMTSLMGAAPVIAGLRAGIAGSLVELGVSAGDVATTMTVEQAFELLDRRAGKVGGD